MRASAVYALGGFAVLLSLLTVGRLAADGVLVLRDREAGKEDTARASVMRSADSITIMVESDAGDMQTASADPSFAALRVVYEDHATKTSYEAVRQDRSILVRGTLKGKPLARTLAIDDSRWLPLLEVSLPRWVLDAGSRQTSFWVIDLPTAEMHKMSAEKVGRERIKVAGGDVEAIKVRMLTQGVPAVIWSSPWWFRAADGTFLRYEMARGMPGTPKTIRELVAEE
jgi:hypothetical protein